MKLAKSANASVSKIGTANDNKRQEPLDAVFESKRVTDMYAEEPVFI